MNLKPLFFAAAMAAALPAQAALTHNATDIRDPNVVDFSAFDGFITTGPKMIAPDVLFTGDAGSQLGAAIAELGANGTWGAGNYFAVGNPVGQLRFALARGLAQGAGALVNLYQPDDSSEVSVMVSAYDENNLMIETHTVTIDTDEFSINAGMFVGIVRDSADIRSIAYSGNFVVADDFTYTTPVPEPETYALMLAALGLVGSMERRRRNSGQA